MEAKIRATRPEVKMILTNRFDPDVRVYKEALYLSQQGFSVEILCWDREREKPESEIIDGIRIRRFYPPARYGSGLRQLLPYLQFGREVRRYLRSRQVDYLHCHDLDGALVGNACRRDHPGARVIFDMHEIYEVQGKKQKLRPLVRQVVKACHHRADAILYVNDLQLVHLDEPDRAKLIFLPNYPDAGNFPSDDKVPADRLRIAYIGSVRHFQQMKNLLDAARGLPDVHVSIHGFGTAYRALQAIQSDYPDARITGPYHFSESTRLFAEADVLYVMYPMDTLQNRESEPIKFFEAIITRTPVIVSPRSRLAAVVQSHGIGYAVDGEDIAAIRALLDHIAANRTELAAKRENMIPIQYHYTWDHVVKNLNTIYQ